MSVEQEAITFTSNGDQSISLKQEIVSGYYNLQQQVTVSGYYNLQQQVAVSGFLQLTTAGNSLCLLQLITAGIWYKQGK